MASGTGIGEFFISLTVDAANGALTVNNLVKGMGDLEVATLAEIGLLYEFAVQLARVTDEGIKASLGFAQFTMHTGLSAQELQRWQIVAEQAHGSAGEVAQSVEALTRHLANLAVGIPDSSLASLQQLGISAFDASGKMKDAFAILGEVRQRLGAVTGDAGQQERILAGLGISPNLRETLLLSAKQFQELAAVAHGMTAVQQGDFDNMRQEFVRIHLIAQDIGRDIGAWVAHLDRVTGALKFTEGVFRGLRDFFEGGGLTPAKQAAVSAEKAREADAIKSFFPQSKETAGETVRRWLDDMLRPADKGYLSPADYSASIARRDQVAGRTVVIDKHDTYNIETNDPNKMKEAIEKHWDETLQKKTIDGFDRQLNNGGY